MIPLAFIDYFKKTWNKLSGVVAIVIIYFIAIVYFPKLENEDLAQFNVNIKKFTFFIMMAILIIFIVVTAKYNRKKDKFMFLSLGISFLLLLLAMLFLSYYPYVNIYSVFVHKACKSLFLIGNVRNPTFQGPLDSSDLEDLISGADCNPSNVWTPGSIQNIFTGLLVRYMVCIFFFLGTVLCLIQALFCMTKTRRQAQ